MWETNSFFLTIKRMREWTRKCEKQTPSSLPLKGWESGQGNVRDKLLLPFHWEGKRVDKEMWGTNSFFLITERVRQGNVRNKLLPPCHWEGERVDKGMWETNSFVLTIERVKELAGKYEKRAPSSLPLKGWQSGQGNVTNKHLPPLQWQIEWVDKGMWETNFLFLTIERVREWTRKCEKITPFP